MSPDVQNTLDQLKAAAAARTEATQHLPVATCLFATGSFKPVIFFATWGGGSAWLQIEPEDLPSFQPYL